jgi:hypothetical protein
VRVDIAFLDAQCHERAGAARPARVSAARGAAGGRGNARGAFACSQVRVPPRLSLGSFCMRALTVRVHHNTATDGLLFIYVFSLVRSEYGHKGRQASQVILLIRCLQFPTRRIDVWERLLSAPHNRFSYAGPGTAGLLFHKHIPKHLFFSLPRPLPPFSLLMLLLKCAGARECAQDKKCPFSKHAKYTAARFF